MKYHTFVLFSHLLVLFKNSHLKLFRHNFNLINILVPFAMLNKLWYLFLRIKAINVFILVEVGKLVNKRVTTLYFWSWNHCQPVTFLKNFRVSFLSIEFRNYLFHQSVKNWTYHFHVSFEWLFVSWKVSETMKL